MSGVVRLVLSVTVLAVGLGVLESPSAQAQGTAAAAFAPLPSATDDTGLLAAADAAGVEETAAQPRRRARARRAAAPQGPAIRVQVFGEVGWEVFDAANSFNAVLGSRSGLSYGAGGRVSHRSGLFGQVDVARFKKDGERAFVSNGQVFQLGIPTTITTTPIDLTIGVESRAPSRPRRGRGPARVGRPARATTYYVGGGLGVFRYQEVADFANEGDDTDDRFRSFHVMGGVHVPVVSVVGLAFDIQKRWVKDAIGTAGVSEAFGETDLGGLTLRVRFTVGM